eukprot:COSAG06_NODE_68_length_26072_cov_68.140377_9_plen_94_part_00
MLSTRTSSVIRLPPARTRVRLYRITLMASATCMHVGRYFEMGTFFYLANDPKVPASIRQNYQKYGLCKDEFQECESAIVSSIPCHLKVIECRC